MKKRFLQFGMTAKAVMIALLLGVAGNMYAYDFSYVCGTGQTLYYNIINTTNHYVELTYPGSSMWNPWNEYIQPEGVIELPEHVNYEGIEYTITKIGSCAFSNCTGLSGDLVIPNSVKTIDYRSFYNCVGFHGSLTFGNSLTYIGQEAFQNCSNLSGNLVIPNTVKTISGGAFKECSGFSGTLTLGNSLEYIVLEAFYNCIGISSFSIPASVIVIGENAFYGTGWYNNHSNGVLYQSNWCLGYKGTASGTLTININTRGIASHAFYGKTFSKIYYNAINCMDVYEDNVPPFKNCSGSLVIGNNVERIPSFMFQWANISGSILIPNSVTTIGNCAFNECNSIHSISLPESIVSIGQQAFNNTGWYNSQSGLLYLNDWCLGYKGTPTGSLLIQDGIKGIADYAFHNCSGYNGNLTLPTSLVYIGNNAFYGCSFIGSLEIPNSVVSIGYSAFMFCSHFNGSLFIPQSIIAIGNGAFYYCPGFTSMTVFADNPPILGDFVFEYVNKSIFVYVPYGTMAAYQAAPGWSDFTNYQEIAYKSIPGYGQGNGNWQFIASPLAENTAPTEIDDMLPTTGTYDLYRFDQTENAEWRNYKANNFNLVNGQGYLYANAEDVNLIFKGTFNEDETKNVELVYDANAYFAGWNLVGNPFPVSAYANKSYYTMNEDGSAIEPVAVSMETAIPACTGVMVKAENTGESVTFSKTAPETAVNQGVLQIVLSQLDPEPVEGSKGGVSTSSTTALDKAIVSFNEGDELGKFVFNKDNAKLYIPQGKEEYAIACAEKLGEMPLNFEATENGEYTISIKAENTEFDYLHLIDNLTSADIDLLPLCKGGKGDSQPATYTFTAKTTDYASRFRLLFSVSGDADDDNDTPFAFISNGSIIVSDANADATLQIVDMTGHIIVSADVARNISTNGMAPGVYFLRLIKGDEVKTQRIVVE